MKCRIGILALCLVLLVSMLPLEGALAANVKPSQYQSYYTDTMLVAMNKIGDSLKTRLTTSTALKNAWNNAKTGFKKLQKAHNKVAVLKKDSKAKSYLSSLKKNVEEGHKRSKKVAASDTTLMKYQKNVMKYLKKYQARVKKLMKVN